MLMFLFIITILTSPFWITPVLMGLAFCLGGSLGVLSWFLSLFSKVDNNGNES